MAKISYARRFTELAAADPDRPMVTCGDQRATRGQIESAANRLARHLAAPDGDASGAGRAGPGTGVGPGDMVTIALPNSVDWFVAVIAAWKLGAIPQPVSPRIPRAELQAIVDLADPPVVVGVEPGAIAGRRCLPPGHRPPADLDDGPLPDAVSPARMAPTSGGSTGRPKLIVSGDRARFDPDQTPFPVGPDRCLVMPGPLYHNGPIVWSYQALLWGGHVVVLPRFDPEATLAAVDEHRAEVLYLVPTMMKRILRLPEEVRRGYDLSSLLVVWHLAEPCPPWLKQAWIDWLGPDRILELYAGTEAQVVTVITGTEWLSHRGSVGRPYGGEVMIADPEGNRLPAGETGEVWLRSERRTPSYRYVGAEARQLGGGWGEGWESLGDLGWVDEDGYLYLADRMQDMILVGGANVYPAEIEAAIQEHPACRSCAVIGLPDEDKGNRVHAIVEADPDQLDEDELRRFLADRLVAYKLPRTLEVVDTPLRSEAGKVRRSALRAERLARPTTPPSPPPPAPPA